jgi:iron complex transport system substrate-binding protein
MSDFFCIFASTKPITRKMQKIIIFLVMISFLCGCAGRSTKSQGADAASADSVVAVAVKYATNFSVRDSAGIRLVSLTSASSSKGGESSYRFALVRSEDVTVPDGYTKVRVPISRTLCMTSLQLSNAVEIACAARSHCDGSVP